MTPEPEHWFEPVADHLGAAYLRYSFTKGTEQEVEFLVDALGLDEGERVLDVGCGPGRHALALARRGMNVVGVDLSEDFIALARETRPLMQKRGGGSMLTLTYLGSERVFKNYNVMGVAKAALEASVRYLAADLGSDNIRVNAISAGPIKTLAAMGISGFSGILGVYRERSPLARNVDTSEVADAALFLLSEAARGITGEILHVDGGYHALGAPLNPPQAAGAEAEG